MSLMEDASAFESLEALVEAVRPRRPRRRGWARAARRPRRAVEHARDGHEPDVDGDGGDGDEDGDEEEEVKAVTRVKLVDGTNPDAAKWSALVTSDVVARLTRLDVGGNELGDAGVEVLARAVGACEQLEELSLYENRVSERGASELARALAANHTVRRTLTTLLLDTNSLKDDGVKALATTFVAVSLGLRTLSLGQNRISDEGMAALARALRERRPLRSTRWCWWATALETLAWGR